LNFGDSMVNRSIRVVNALAAALVLAVVGGAHSAFADFGWAKAQPAAAASGTDGDVYAMTTKPDGTTTLTIYTPAPGGTASALRARLAAEGVRDLVGPAQVAAPALPCSFGTASTLVCPPVKWARNGFNHPQVYFLDHTSAAWPVTAVVPNWN